MYKNIEILDKKKHEKKGFETISDIEVAKASGYIPLGANEILDMAAFTPVIITSKEGEFAAYTGVNSEVNIFNSQNVYIPQFVKTYPFLNIVVKDSDEKLNNVIGIDNSKYVSNNKENKIFKKDQELDEIAQKKIQGVRDLNTQRDLSKKIVLELNKNDLLEKKDFKVIAGDKEQILLKEFYVVNREKLVKLDDETLATWARKGWMSLIDAHIKSIANFQRVIQK